MLYIVGTVACTNFEANRKQLILIDLKQACSSVTVNFIMINNCYCY